MGKDDCRGNMATLEKEKEELWAKMTVGEDKTTRKGVVGKNDRGGKTLPQKKGRRGVVGKDDCGGRQDHKKRRNCG